METKVITFYNLKNHILFTNAKVVRSKINLVRQ